MSLWESSAAELLARTASADSTPGGGSVAAISGALGLGLVCMALEVTVRRADAAPEVAALLERAKRLLDGLKAHPDADVVAFEGYMAALALPKADAEQRARRKEALHGAVYAATEAPLAAARDLLAALELAEQAAALAHRRIVSDVGAGAELLAAALQATLLNVDINAGSLLAGDRTQAEDERGHLSERAAACAGLIRRAVADRLGV